MIASAYMFIWMEYFILKLHTKVNYFHLLDTKLQYQSPMKPYVFIGVTLAWTNTIHFDVQVLNYLTSKLISACMLSKARSKLSTVFEWSLLYGFALEEKSDVCTGKDYCSCQPNKIIMTDLITKMLKQCSNPEVRYVYHRFHPCTVLEMLSWKCVLHATS